MGYLIPRPTRIVLPLPKPLPVVPKQRVKVVFCNQAAVEAADRGDKSCDGYRVVALED